jgi:glycosyltransferase involved in cell wall biosynthesis
MHVLVLSDTFPNALEPWRGPYNRRQIECLARLCRVTVVNPFPWTLPLRKAAYRALTKKRDDVMAPVPIYHPVFRYTPVAGRAATWRGVAAAARAAIQDHGLGPFDVVLATFVYPHGRSALALAPELGVPYVIKARGSDLHALPARGRRRKRTAEAVRGAAAVVCVSSNLARIAADLGADEDRTHVLPNGVDAERFRLMPREEARRRLGLPADRPTVLFVGSLLPVKGIDVLLDAAEQLFAQSEDACLLIAGEGAQRGLVDKRKAALGCRLLTLGHVERDSVPLWMNAADVLVLPSRNEGCPNVVLEALACGTPVVASRVGAVPDLLDAACGAIVRPGQTEELARALAMALREDWDRTAIRRRAEGRTWADNARTLFGILRTAVKNAQRS